MGSSQPEHFNPKRTRIDSIDLLRGIVMVIMMLDHTRDFVHRDVLQGFDPTDLSRTNVMLFFTRWITHFCAPMFVFLAGTGAYLHFIRGKSKRDLSRFLITRGLWLILLEFTVVRISVFFNVDYRFLGAMQVIWVIGVSMILLAALIHLPLRVVAGFGIGMIAFTTCWIVIRCKAVGRVLIVRFQATGRSSILYCTNRLRHFPWSDLPAR